MSKNNSNVVAGLVFCPSCGSLLEVGLAEDQVKCDVCACVQQAEIFENIEVVTSSRANAFSRANREITIWKSEMEVKKQEKATINERCPKCGNPEMNFHTMQLRSADEGQTVFYSCPKCAHKFSLNS